MSEKPRVSLVLSEALLEVAKVGNMGAEKHGLHNWRENPLPYSHHLDAALRHIISYNNGKRVDAESGCSNLAHASWRLLALLEMEIQGVGTDDLFSGYKKDKT